MQFVSVCNLQIALCSLAKVRIQFRASLKVGVRITVRATFVRNFRLHMRNFEIAHVHFANCVQQWHFS